MLSPRLSSVAAGALCAFLTLGASHAQTIRMEFTATFDEIEIAGLDIPASVIVTGEVVWDASASSYSTNGVNSRSWPIMSFEATGVGSTLTGGSLDFTTSVGPVSGSNYLQTIHSPTNSDSSLYWRSDLESVPPAYIFGEMDINTIGVEAMPLFTSPLPTNADAYVGTRRPFEIRVSLVTDSFDSAVLSGPVTVNFVEVGGCCLPDLTCTDAVAADCALLGGVYAGDGTNCSDVVCVPVTPTCIAETTGEIPPNVDILDLLNFLSVWFPASDGQPCE